MSLPLVSVVIPTAGRPEYLKRAIESALISAPNGDTEVIVVPNGPDNTWREILDLFRRDDRVRVLPVDTAHANVARNHGMRAATGKYIRFLDDDDMLHVDGCLLQYDLLERTGAEICSGTVDLLDKHGTVFKTWEQPLTADLVEAVLCPRRVTHLAAHVFLRKSVDFLRWEETTNIGQDTHWMMFLCAARDFNWCKTPAKVGIWQHHEGRRISGAANANAHNKVTAEMLLCAVEAIHDAGRLNIVRRDAAAAGLWACIHNAFFLEPTYWFRIMRRGRRFIDGTFPDVALYRISTGQLVPPLVLEVTMLPKRWINHWVRQLRRRAGILPPW